MPSLVASLTSPARQGGAHVKPLVAIKASLSLWLLDQGRPRRSKAEAMVSTEKAWGQPAQCPSPAGPVLAPGTPPPKFETRTHRWGAAGPGRGRWGGGCRGRAARGRAADGRAPVELEGAVVPRGRHCRRRRQPALSLHAARPGHSDLERRPGRVALPGRRVYAPRSAIVRRAAPRGQRPSGTLVARGRPRLSNRRAPRAVLRSCPMLQRGWCGKMARWPAPTTAGALSATARAWPSRRRRRPRPRRALAPRAGRAHRPSPLARRRA